ncbi:hypothetical protein ACRQ5Q_22230 [Bradyrhizobium sp. PMVTL-01]|uniref:hypothetical protein n=1 Tax=Bradyrhizobium sp. PMVTL-01 TaxID=3434999 RepID=UPI003F7169E6
MLLLTTIWVVLVMPVTNDKLPNPQQMELQGVYFSSQDDCETFSRQRIDTLREMGYAKRTERNWTQIIGKDRAPSDAQVTYTCVERKE